MNSSNTQGKNYIDISSNFYGLSTMSIEEKKRLIEAQGTVQLDSMTPEQIENSAESILQNFIQETGEDSEMSAQAFEFLSNIRTQGNFESVTPAHLRIAADMIERGL